MNPSPDDLIISSDKLPYEAPVLIEYGNIAMITRAATRGAADGGDDHTSDLGGTS